MQDAGRNATYTSKTTHNDLIECIGSFIRNSILKQVKEVKYYSVLCDEVIDVACKQQVSIVLRFVDSDCNIQEEFLDFIKVERITGEVLAREIKNVLARHGLDFQNCRGQGYDGARNMSAANGVQGRLSAENSNSHILNLCIVNACSLPPIRNMSSAITETANFFQNSAKSLEKVVDDRTPTVKVKDNKTIVAANGLSKMYHSFSFIVSFVVTRNAMSIIKPVSVKLQYTSYDS